MYSSTKDILRDLLSQEWNDKQVWEWIRDADKEKKLTAALEFKGELYDETPYKIMYVGHAFNGWKEFDASECKSLDATVHVICNQSGRDALETIVNSEGVKGNNRRTYRHINSKFFRFIKELLQLLGESDAPLTEKTFYADSQKWQQKYIWTNLYCISPLNGGNPSDEFIKNSMLQYTEKMRLQILQHKPNLVIFCPKAGYFAPWKRRPTFEGILDQYKTVTESETIIGSGSIANSQIIVIKRPDRRELSNEGVKKMAEDVFDYIKAGGQIRELRHN